MSEKNTYGQILKSSSIMGGAAVITMIAGMVKTKFAAVLIGAAGVGLLASYTAIQGLIQTLAGLGINSSGVRDVAAAVAKGDQEAIGRAVKTLRRMCWLTGILGMLTVAALSPLIGQMTFGSGGHNLEIAALGGIILFVNISGGQLALIQGSRRIGDVARVNIVSAVTGALLSTGFYFWLGMRGIVPALIISAGVQLIISWYYAKRVSIPEVGMTWHESLKEASSMARMGIAMMWTELVSSLVSYATVLMITNRFDLHAVGLYSAAFALSGMFVNFVLQAMGTDYYPRLVAIAHDKSTMNQMVNEQTEIGLLLAFPGIIAMLIFAPWIIHLFFSKEFTPALALLKWFILGCFVRVIQWPIGYMQLALGRVGIWFSTQTLLSAIHLFLIWQLIQLIGIEGASIAFFVLYVISIILIKSVGNYLTGFKWEKRTFIMIIKLSLLITITFLIEHFGKGRWTYWAVMIIFIESLIYSIYGLVSRLRKDHLIIGLLLRIPGVRRVINV